MKNIDWPLIQREHDTGKSQRDLIAAYGISYSDIAKAKKNGDFKPLSRSAATARAAKLKPHRKLSLDERKVISDRMKKMFVDRPELHPNRKVANNRSKMSYPERLAYDYFQRSGVDFIHNAKIGSYYVDFLIGKIAIEIDGEYWHKDKTYDEKRDFFITSSGITIIRIKASDITKDTDNLLLQKATNGGIDPEFLKEFRNKQREALETKSRCVCGNTKFKHSMYCKRCADDKKVKFGDKEALTSKLAELDYNYRAVGRFYGVSDNMIRKYCKRMGIPIMKNRFRHQGVVQR